MKFFLTNFVKLKKNELSCFTKCDVDFGEKTKMKQSEPKFAQKLTNSKKQLQTTKYCTNQRQTNELSNGEIGSRKIILFVAFCHLYTEQTIEDNQDIKSNK